jgi:hypothetical protein
MSTPNQFIEADQYGQGEYSPPIAPDQSASTALEIAQTYIARGWTPVPIPFRAKGPIGAGWQVRRIDNSTVATYFNGARQNIGGMAGPQSGGLTDIDLDSAEAVAIAPYLLPRTGAIFGRASSRASHCLYVTDLAGKIDKAVIDFDDPDAKNPDRKASLVELRIGGGGKGAQTVFPGSVHESGEPIEWEETGDPASVDGADLLRRVQLIAAASLIARNWPAEGGRHKAALTVGGFFSRAGISETDIATIVQAIARAACDEEWKDRVRAAKDQAAYHLQGNDVRGLPMLAELVGDAAASKIAEWVGYSSARGLQLFTADAPSTVPSQVAEAPIETPAWWRDAADIPPREALYGKHFMRCSIGATIGAGGRAKTTQGTYEAISMAVGFDLTTGEILPKGPLRVWFINAEEDKNELDRRFAATCLRHNVSRERLGGPLFVESVSENPMRLATLVGGNPTLNQAALGRMRDFITRNQIDVFMIDPFISFHTVNESANADMDLLIKGGLASIAKATNSHGEIFHHPGKPKPGQDTTVEDGRGASAILYAVRSARVFNFMTPAEATKLGIPEDQRRLHIRISNGKANMAPIGKAHWIKIGVENLPNGDEVACASLWTPPNPFDGVTSAGVELARELARTGAHRADSRSSDWFGYPLARQLKIHVKPGQDNAPEDLARLKAIIKIWLKNNA